MIVEVKLGEYSNDLIDILNVLKFKAFKHDINQNILDYISTNQWNISNSAVTCQLESLK